MEDGGVHADEGVVADLMAVEHRAVADVHLVADDNVLDRAGGRAGVDDGVVLHGGVLADDDAVTQAVFADSAMLAKLPRGAVHISMSTISAA